MEDYYNSKCDEDVRECSSCSYNSCSNTLPDFDCLNLGVPDDNCKCPGEGFKFSLRKSAMKMRPDTNTSDEEVKEMFC